MRTSTRLSCYAVPFRRHAPSGTCRLSGRSSMDLLRTNRRLLAGVSRRISVAAAQEHISDLARTRRGRVSSNPVLASPDWSSSRRLSRGRSSYSVRAGPILRRCIGISELCVTRFVILAREPTRPSLVELKRPSNTDAQSMVRHNSSPTDFSPRSE